jgi:hypothetical protein
MFAALSDATLPLTPAVVAHAHPLTTARATTRPGRIRPVADILAPVTMIFPMIPVVFAPIHAVFQPVHRPALVLGVPDIFSMIPDVLPSVATILAPIHATFQAVSCSGMVLEKLPSLLRRHVLQSVFGHLMRCPRMLLSPLLAFFRCRVLPPLLHVFLHPLTSLRWSVLPMLLSSLRSGHRVLVGLLCMIRSRSAWTMKPFRLSTAVMVAVFSPCSLRIDHRKAQDQRSCHDPRYSLSHLALLLTNKKRYSLDNRRNSVTFLPLR